MSLSSLSSISSHMDEGGEVIRTFNSVILKGLAAKIPDSYLDNFKSLNGDVVDFVEPDQQVHTQ
ncbi:hypothetical protein SISNIDRAFT_140741 [Sistotremastrum niveocremeum HHB9708]|uniref:Inhibitor I9 domain-containing protein n=1 Tax=Sistotremastrum niveocremeum HHB9708 TaxID=1314777 RepID=A0A165A155_9AGAM|nr:hypothetical protein SISNIDRAFT_140741 [Sistotremastrum niveocremeum HHB9708]